MKLFSFSKEEKAGVGVETSKGTFNLSNAFMIYQKAKGIRQPMAIDFLQVLVEMGYCSGKMIRQILDDSWVQSKQEELRLIQDYSINLPIARPSKIIGLGRNYKAHAKEFDHDIPDEPLFFAKAPSSVIPHEADIIIPNWLDQRVDHEAELAFIIGKQGKNIQKEEAMSYIAGYTILNDVTARTMQKEDFKNSKPWYRSKSLDTFCPVGPYLIPADEISDPHSLEISLSVNNEERQKASTASMIFKIPEIVVYLSRFMTLHAGDIVATGTPKGVSPIKDGDVIEVTITDLGTLRNRVVKET